MNRSALHRIARSLIRNSLCAIIALGFLGGVGATAAPVAYDEATGGDLPESVIFGTPFTPVFAFDLGANTIRGSAFIDYRPESVATGKAADFDQFAFVIPAGAALVDIRLQATVTNVIGSLPSVYSFHTTLYAGSWPTIPLVAVVEQRSNLLDPDVPVSGSFAAGLPLSAGPYLFYTDLLDAVQTGEAIFWDYTWTFTVAVPESSSLLLLAAALLLLGFAGAGRYGAQGRCAVRRSTRGGGISF